MGIKGFIQNHNNQLHDLLDKCVWKTSLIACEASYLATYHINQLLNEDAAIILPKLDQAFFYQCITAIANIGQPPDPSTASLDVRNPALWTSFLFYHTLQPADYQPTGRITPMQPMMNSIAAQTEQNYKNYVDWTFKSRLELWLHMQIISYQPDDPNSYFQLHQTHC
jgi:hypothetical protein